MRFDPSNMWYYSEGGEPVPVGEIPACGGYTPDDPSWEQLGRLEGLLGEATAWYEGLVANGYEGMPAHMKRGIDAWYVALATSYQRIRELKGSVGAYKEGLLKRRVPRPSYLY